MKPVKIEIGRWYTATRIYETVSVNLTFKFWAMLPIEDRNCIEWFNQYLSPLNVRGIEIIDYLVIGYTVKDETEYFLANYLTTSSVKELGTQSMGQ